MDNIDTAQAVAIIGYGEVGKILGAGLNGKPGVASIAVFDRKFGQSADATRLQEHATRAGAAVTPSLADLCKSATVLMSAVTASNTLAVARGTACSLKPGTVFLDLNSASPKTKQRAAKEIEEAGGHYVDAALMSAVPPHGIKVPMLLGGKHAQALAILLNQWGMNAAVVSADVGIPSAIKMCRSIMIKGMEALVIESYSTALHYGVSNEVLNSLGESFPHIDWPLQGAYFFSRVVQHGERRAEEMRESAATVREAGFAPVMATSIAEKIGWISKLAKAGLFDSVPEGASWPEYAKQLVSRSDGRRA